MEVIIRTSSAERAVEIQHSIYTGPQFHDTGQQTFPTVEKGEKKNLKLGVQSSSLEILSDASL